MNREEIQQGATAYLTWFCDAGALADGPAWEAWQKWTEEHTNAERLAVTGAALIGFQMGRAAK